MNRGWCHRPGSGSPDPALRLQRHAFEFRPRAGAACCRSAHAYATEPSASIVPPLAAKGRGAGGRGRRRATSAYEVSAREVIGCPSIARARRNAGANTQSASWVDREAGGDRNASEALARRATSGLTTAGGGSAPSSARRESSRRPRRRSSPRSTPAAIAASHERRAAGVFSACRNLIRSIWRPC
jgi:hypothetical protein